MTKMNKIVKWGLQEDVLEKHYKEGWGYERIASYLQSKYPEIDDIRNISPMSVKRFLDSHNEQNLVELEEAGKDPLTEMRKEFETRMRSLISDAEILKNKSNKLLADAMNNNASLSDIAKLIRAQRENIDQIRKNLVSLMEFIEVRYTRPLERIYEKKELNITNIFVDLGRFVGLELCPECKKKFNEYIKNKGEELLKVHE